MRESVRQKRSGRVGNLGCWAAISTRKCRVNARQFDVRARGAEPENSGNGRLRRSKMAKTRQCQSRWFFSRISRRWPKLARGFGHLELARTWSVRRALRKSEKRPRSKFSRMNAGSASGVVRGFMLRTGHRRLAACIAELVDWMGILYLPPPAERHRPSARLHGTPSGSTSLLQFL